MASVWAGFSQTLNVPPRATNAMTGSQFVKVITPMVAPGVGPERENWILAQIQSGNVPNFLRTLKPINVSATIKGTNHTATYYVTPDYMAIGSDEDYFLEPMSPLMAQRVANQLGCTLPTRKMVNQIWTNAAVKMNPQPISPSPAMITVPVFDAHNTMVRTQRWTFTNSFPLGALVSGDKKDVVISTLIYSNLHASVPKPVVIYGWHYTSGSPIQPLYNGHEETYADYSHGIRLVQMNMTVDGSATTVTTVLTNPNLAKLLSDESTSEATTTNGTIVTPRYTLYSMSPVIITPPALRAVKPGANLDLSVLPVGDLPLSYRWKFNGAIINGATNSILPLKNLQGTNTGSYQVIVTNNSGSVTSAPAILNVSSVSFPNLFADDFDTNSSANWNLFWGASNGIPDYTVDWAYDYGATRYTFNGATFVIPPAPNSSGSTKGVKLTVNANDTNAAIAGVNIYAKNKNFSGNFVVKFDMWINYPGNAGGSGASGSTQHGIFGINHLGTQANWSATSASSTDGIWLGASGEGDDSRDYRAYVGNLSGVQTELTGAPSGLSAADNTAAIYQTLFPATQFETAGAPGKNWVACEVVQTNNNLIWKLNGTVIASRTNTSSFTSGTVMLGLMDVFSSIASPAEDSFVLFDNLRVENLSAAAIAAPGISVQPQNQLVNAAADANFSVGATGSNPLNYQWLFNGTAIAAASNSFFFVTNVQTANVGSYSVQISNAAGSALSSDATLTLASSAPTLKSAKWMNNQLQFALVGLTNKSCIIDASTNLTNWIALQTSNPPFLYSEVTTNLSRRFFRSRQQP